MRISLNVTKEKIELLIAISGALFGIVGTTVGLLSYQQANKSLELARTSDERARQAQDAARLVEVKQYLADAWDLLGGEVGSTDFGNPTEDRRKLELARRLIEKAMLLEPRSSGAYYHYAVYQYGKGDLRAAESALIKAVRIDPENRSALIGLNIVQLELRGISRKTVAEKGKEIEEKILKDLAENSHDKPPNPELPPDG